MLTKCIVDQCRITKKISKAKKECYNAKTFFINATRNCAIQHENVLANAKTCYPTRIRVIHCKNVLSITNNRSYNAKTECPARKRITECPARKRVIQRENVLCNAKRVIQHKTCYPTRKCVIQRVNALSNAKTFYPARKCVIQLEIVLSNEKTRHSTRKRVLQLQNMLSNVKHVIQCITYYPTRTLVIQRENSLNKAKTFYPTKNVLHAKTRFPRRKHLIQCRKRDTSAQNVYSKCVRSVLAFCSFIISPEYVYDFQC